MISLPVAAVNASDMLTLLVVSVGAGLGATTIFAIVVYSASRSTHARQAGRSRVSIAFAVAAVVAFVLFVGLIVFGVQIMLAEGSIDV